MGEDEVLRMAYCKQCAQWWVYITENEESCPDCPECDKPMTHDGE